MNILRFKLKKKKEVIMSNTKRILYIHPYLFFCFSPQICTEPFIRFSNYLNSKKTELNGDIQEEYLDLRIEPQLDYWPANIDEYRNALKELLYNIYERFKFDIAAISCYSDFAYLNSVEVASVIKHFINPECDIVVGGVHPSIFPKNFYSQNIPSYFDNFYPKNCSPFDYIIIDEGEIPFFNFVQNSLSGTIKRRKNLNENPIILEGECLENLDELPPLNLELYKKYKNAIKGIGSFYIRFTRGCAFRCKFCLPSENYSKACKKVRSRSIENCIADLKSIINTDWLKIRQLHIIDSMFFPKRSMRDRFFEELEKLSEKINFRINVFDRVETTTLKDLDNYKKYNMILGLGLESVSKKLLTRMGKISGKNALQIDNGGKNYLKKTREIIKYSNKMDIAVVYFYLLGIPGTDKKTLNERWAFFFEKNNGAVPLMEKYKINLEFFPFELFTGNEIYDKGEEMFGAKYYYKEWWKIFDSDQPGFGCILDPSENLSFKQGLKATKDFVKSVFRTQTKLKNSFYSFPKFIGFKKDFDKLGKISEGL
ncbi:MAG: radical SAM protein [Promethearchaeota archaeon]|nr:MAG: radical SAM protein [Candidatus Lokiarchaeota archaeon]